MGPEEASSTGAGGAAAAPAASDAATTSAAESKEPERPSDADIISQENAIREAEADRIPFLGDVEPLANLREEYQHGSEVFRTKIDGLERTYGGIRRARGDGNCFFRSFMFAYIEDLLQRRDYEERHRVTATIHGLKEKMKAAGFEPLVFEDAQDLLLDQLNGINGGPDALTPEMLLINMRDANVSNMIVAFLRLATSAEIGARSDFFCPFVMGISVEELSVEQFRQKCVEPMGEESDEVHIVALTDVLQVPIRVLYLDRSVDSGDPTAVNHHDFVPEALSAAVANGSKPASAVEPHVQLLYRPGHYDILYQRTGVAAGGSGTAAAAPSGSSHEQPAGMDDSAVSAALAAAMAKFKDPPGSTSAS
jgi:ubiquitin thioesterase protein OTUB1